MAPGAREQGFSRRHRFCAQGAYGAALKSRRKARGELAILHVETSPTGASRLGVALSRKLVRSSVERNRIKRLVREAFRRHAIKGLALDCVVTLRGKTQGPAIDRAAAEIAGLFDRFSSTAK
jgi:ribonuclease P protein component